MMRQHKYTVITGFLFMASMVTAFCPETAIAGGITEFANPVQQVVDTLRGPVGKLIAIFMIILCGVGYWFSRGEEVSGLWKGFLGVVMIICLISLASPIVDKLFTFSGAVL